MVIHCHGILLYNRALGRLCMASDLLCSVNVNEKDELLQMETNKRDIYVNKRSYVALEKKESNND